MCTSSLPAQELSPGHIEPAAAAGQLEVLLVEDQLTIRRGLELIVRADGMRVAGLASDAQQARSLVARRRIDVALIAAGLGSGRGVQLVSELSLVSPAVPVVLHVSANEPKQLAHARASRARGIVLTSSEPSVLLHALRTAASGATSFDPAATTVPDRSPLSTLSPREREILRMLAGGLTALEIARELRISPETVRTHVVNARHKLGAKTRVQAVALSVSELLY